MAGRYWKLNNQKVYWIKDDHVAFTFPQYATYGLRTRMYPFGALGLIIYSIPLCLPELVITSQDHCFG
jgi:hypothetical protein